MSKTSAKRYVTMLNGCFLLINRFVEMSKAFSVHFFNHAVEIFYALFDCAH